MKSLLGELKRITKHCQKNGLNNHFKYQRESKEDRAYFAYVAESKVQKAKPILQRRKKYEVKICGVPIHK